MRNVTEDAQLFPLTPAPRCCHATQSVRVMVAPVFICQALLLPNRHSLALPEHSYEAGNQGQAPRAFTCMLASALLTAAVCVFKVRRVHAKLWHLRYVCKPERAGSVRLSWSLIHAKKFH
jgi:hypothetical protein